MLTEIVLENLAYLIREKGLKIGEFEKLAGYSQGYMSRLRSGSCMLAVDAVEKFAGILDVPVEYLYTERQKGWAKRDPWRSNCEVYVCPECKQTCYCRAKSCTYKYCPNCGKEVLKE